MTRSRKLSCVVLVLLAISGCLDLSESSSEVVASRDVAPIVTQGTAESLVGDVDGFGTGRTCGFQYADINQFNPGPADPPGTDVVMVTSAYTRPLSTNPYVSNPRALLPPATLRHTLGIPAGCTVSSVELEMCTADVDDQPISWLDDQLFVDGVEVAGAFDNINQYIGGVAGYTGLVRLTLDPAFFPLVADGRLDVLVDERGRTTDNPNTSEIFAIDYSLLRVRYECREATWTPTGSLACDRLLHTATRLPSGKVLVVGGYNPSTELYDPATGTWAASGRTRTNHRYHTATLLPSGNVLVAGGLGASATASAEVYDPAVGTWTPTANLLTFRSHHAAVLLASGKVLVVGGLDSSGRALASAELYDPASGSWSATGTLSSARSRHTATLLPSGQVLVAGGQNANGRLPSAELYDPTSGTWAVVGAMGTARSQHTATLLASGAVLVAGGAQDGPPATRAELYDPVTRTWVATGSMGQPRRNHTATLLPSGQVLVAGGYDDFTGIHTAAELYNPASGTWSPTASMLEERYQHTATLLADGRVLAVGGFSNGNQASAELYGYAIAPASCKQLLEREPGTPSGFYTIDPDGSGPGAPFEAYCEMTRDGGGWTLVMTGSDDNQNTWSWNRRTLMTTDRTLVGNVREPHRDFKSPSLHTIPFRDLLFVHAPSGVWAAYGAVGNGTTDVGSFMAAINAPVCDLRLADNGYPLTAGTLTRRGKLCDTDLYFHLGDFDGTYSGYSVDYCRRTNDSQDTTYGPGWSIGNNNGCPFDDPVGASFGPDANNSHVGQEYSYAGFGWPLGLNTGTASRAENYIQMFVR